MPEFDPFAYKTLKEIYRAYDRYFKGLDSEGKISEATLFSDSRDLLISSKEIVCSYGLISEGYYSEDGFLDFLENVVSLFRSDSRKLVLNPDLLTKALDYDLLGEYSVWGRFFMDYGKIGSRREIAFSAISSENCERFAPKLFEIFGESFSGDQ